MTKSNTLETGLEIAVIGMAGKFPGADNLDRFWDNLKSGVESVSVFSTEELRRSGISERLLENPAYVRSYGVLRDRAYFDSSFFGYSPKEAERMDPLIRLFHECAWEALEDAGYDPVSYQGAIGLYAGSSDGFGWQVVKTLKSMNDPGEETSTHITDTGLLLSTWVSYKLNLRGPSLTMFTACSTSLVAIHTASRALLTGECTMALAGAGSVLAAEASGYLYQEGMIMSPDGHCRPFDAAARGTVYGEGVGIVLLKRLKHAEADRDSIRAIIKATAVNNDGSGKASFTAPGKTRITDVVRTVFKLSRLAAEGIGYIETHGTATPLGDAIEIEALKEAFYTGKRGYCGIGSVKSNIGHLDVAAGIAGFIKTVQALEHGLIPPSLHFETPNPTIDFINSPFYINAALSCWEGKYPLRAGVCAFGVGGTNAFVLLEGAAPPVSVEEEPGPRLLVFSARTGPALEQMTATLAAYFRENPGVNLVDATYTMQLGRRVFNHRRMLVCASTAEAAQALADLDPRSVYTSELKAKEKPDDTVRELLQSLVAARSSFADEQIRSVLEKIGTAWLKGAVIDWQEFYAGSTGDSGQRPYRIPLPTYPFERQYYWIETNARALAAEAEQVLLLVVDEHGLETKIKERFQQRGRPVVVVRTGSNSTFTRTPTGEFLVNPEQEDHYDALFQVLAGGGTDTGTQAGAETGKTATMLYQRPPLSTEYAPPRDEIEQALVGIWQKFFGIGEIGIHDNFFELGGDSLKAITVVGEIHRELDVRVPIPELFQTSTIRGLARYIKGTGQDRYSAIEAVERKEYYPLSSVQRRIYLLHQVDPGSTGYNTPLLFHLEGRLDRERLEESFKTLLTRHESLRTSFVVVGGETVQRIHHNLILKVDYHDLTVNQSQSKNFGGVGGGWHLSPNQKVFGGVGTFLQKGSDPPEAIIKHFIRPFSLSRAPLFRVGLVKAGEERHLLLTDMDHIVTDGSSIGILVREFMALYAEQSLSRLRIQYKDYAQWQSSEKQREAMKRQEAYWSEQFAGELPVLNLPIDFTRPPVQSFAGRTLVFEIRGEEVEGLRQLARSEDTTLFMILLSLYNILLAKICGQEDIVVGTPIAGRTHADLRKVIGMLVNTLALRNHPLMEKTVREFLKEVKANTLSAFENQDYLFEDLVEHPDLDLHRDVSRNPVFDTMFNLLNFQSQYEADLSLDIPGLSLKPREYERGVSIFDLSLQGGEMEQGLWFSLEFCTKLFKPETIERFSGYFRRIVSAAAAGPDREIAGIEIISGAEKRQILEDFNSLEFNAANFDLIPGLFAEQVKRQPHGTALVFEKQQLTYQELHRHADTRAQWLRQKGVGPEVIVALRLERSLEMIIAILAVMKAGGTYLPIDPTLPEERIDYMLADSGAEIVLTDNVLSSRSACLPAAVNHFPAASLCYIIYTSGSTGAPKGVMLEQRTLLNLVRYQYQYTSVDFSRVLQFTTIGFDVSLQEIFSTLLAGGTLVLVPGETIKNIPRLFDVIRRDCIKTLFLPASFLKFIFNEPEYTAIFPGCVAHIVSAGEQVMVTQGFRNYLKAHRVYLHNHYGPAETHVVTTLTLSPQGEIPALPFIGKPLANTLIYIVNKGLQLQPLGIAGELVIGGIQVGRGYLNKPELTFERFCLRRPGGLFSRKPPPWTPRKSFLLYQTGDLARWMVDGNIEFLGRMDSQVKIRGFRIEPGEIEARLMNMKEIKEAVVAVKENPGGEKYLCAYVVAAQENSIDVTELRNKLSNVLPDFMLPSFFVLLAEIPLTPNGKVNRKTLPEPQREPGMKLPVPGNKLEMELAELWGEVLGIRKDTIDVDADFFQLGGHSLKAAVLTARIHKHFNVEITLAEMFRHPTIRTLAKVIREAEESRYTSIEPVEKKEYYPLSSAQKRLYILQHLDPDSTVYHMPQAMQLLGQLDKDRLEQIEQIFQQLVWRHEGFRTSFLTVNNEPVQRIEHENYKLQITNYKQIPSPKVRNTKTKDQPSSNKKFLEVNKKFLEVQEPFYQKGSWPPEAIIKKFIRPFDLSQAPLLRVGLISMAEQRHLLVVDMHHIVSDGTSVRLLIREFMTLFRGETLTGLRIHYKDYAVWQHSEAARWKIKLQEEFWLREFSGEMPVLNLPYDGPRPGVQSFAGSNFSFALEARETAALNQLALQQDVTLFMVLTALFNILLAKLSGQEDIVIGTPTAGRGHADLEKVMGMLVNTLALRNYPGADKPFKGFLQEVGARALDAFANQDYQFENLVGQVAVVRNPGRSPLFDVMLGLQNMEFPLEEAPGAADRQQALDYDYDSGVSRFDMTWNALEKQGQLEFTVEYSTHLFKKETIERFILCFKQLVSFAVSSSGQKRNSITDTRISNMEILPQEEKQRILFEFNPPETGYPRNKTIQEIFANQLEEIPDHIALIEKNPESKIQNSGHHLTYRELNEKANHVARRLKTKGVQPGTIAAIMVERSLGRIVGLLGILKAGAAYLPIDPEYPGERLRYMLEDSGTNILLTTGSYSNSLGLIPGPEVLIDLLEGSPFNSHHSSFTEPPNHSENLVYIIYTSGSTGKPKGVMVKHSSVLRLVTDPNYIRFSPGDRLLPTGAAAFDISTFEIWGPLLNKGTVFLVTKEIILNAEKLAAVLTTHSISILHLIPPLFNQLAAQSLHVYAGLKSLLVGGDLVQPTYINKVREKYPHLKILHMYGPTENTTFSTFFWVDKDYEFNIPIGKPISNSMVIILDKTGHMQPVGVAGELCVGGDGLAKGYLNNPELTAERFCLRWPGNRFEIRFPGPSQNFLLEGIKENKKPLPITYSSSPIYQTGDLGRWLQDGNIQFLGRIDRQVKIRGFRVELKEIEIPLLTHRHISEAAVLAREDKNGDKTLCAYIVSEQELSAGELRDFLSGKLPDYMIPSYFIKLEKIPVTPNGKLDTRTLPEPGLQTGGIYAAPKGWIEECLVDTWSEILSIDRNRIGRDANFFELGGHSLRAMVMIASIQKTLNAEVPLAQVFGTPTIAGLGQYIRETITPGETYRSIEPGEKKEYDVLSSAQKRLYILQQMDLESTVYNLPQVIPLDTAADFEVEKNLTEHLVSRLIRRHESFRTSFITVNREPVQRIKKENDRLAITSYQRKEGGFSWKVQEEFVRPFDLANPPLLRVGLRQLAGNQHLLLVDMHHIISDGVSMEILVREFLSLYQGQDLPEPRLHYRDYAAWQNRQENRESVKPQESYWLSVFPGEIPVSDLPTDYPRPPVQSFAGSSIDFEIHEKTTGEFNRLAVRHGATLYMVLVTLFNLFLSRLGRQEDIVIGTPVAGRRHADVQEIIGMFVNTLALRNHAGGETSFITFLHQVKETTIKAFENQDYPFEDLVERVDVQRDISRNPLFDVMFSLQNLSNLTANTAEKPARGFGLELDPDEKPPGTSKFDLTLVAVERDSRLYFTFEYCTLLFKEETVKRFVTYFQRLASSVVESPGEPLSRFVMLPPAEKKQILLDFNDTGGEYPKDKTLHHLFEEQVERTPDKVALVVSCGQILNAPGGVRLSYNKLNEKANQLAVLLIEKGVLAGTIVGIKVVRSIEMMIGILGILKAGGAYLPIDPENPGERIAYMLADSSAKLLLNTTDIAEAISTPRVSNRMGAPHPPKGASFRLHLSPWVNAPITSLAYTIYTSGTTGKPKGVLVSHSNLCPLLHYGYRHLAIDSTQHTMQNLPYYFDWSVWEIFITLTTGAALFIIPEELRLNPGEGIAFLLRYGITILHITPTQWHYFLQTHQPMNTLKYLFLGAEKLTHNLVKHTIPYIGADCRLFNMYGPTETTIISSVLEINRARNDYCPGGSGIPIGKPVGNTMLLVLDKHLEMCPIKVAGELYIGGDGVARGYLNNPEISAERFCLRRPGGALFKKTAPPGPPDKNFLLDTLPSTRHSSPVYKTGDLVRWWENGNVEFLGRIDQQVKIRGYRIELGEIENRLSAHERVKEAVVISKKDHKGERYLCAYIVSNDEMPVPGLKEHLLKYLPAYMVPAYFVPLQRIPLTVNGKLDRRALPEPGIKAGVEEAPPGSLLEQKLAKIWSEVLQVPLAKIGIDSDFFELGGHSLKGAQLLAKVQEELNAGISLPVLFQAPTIRQLASIITTDRPTLNAAAAMEERDYYPVSFNQQRVWKYQHQHPGSSAYNIFARIRFQHDVQVEGIRATLLNLIRRHESIRTYFKEIQGKPVQLIQSSVKNDVPLQIIDLSPLRPGKREHETQILYEENSRLPFDLSAAPLFRAILVKQEAAHWDFIFIIHHIITDGWSYERLIKEFQAIYSGSPEGRDLRLGPLPVRYRDFALWQRRRVKDPLSKAEALHYWQSKLEQGLPELQLPRDFSQPSPDRGGITFRSVVPREIKENLKKLAKAHQTSLFMVLFSAFNLLLSSLTGQKEIVCRVPAAGRDQPELHPIIGYFVNSIIVKNQVKDSEHFVDLLHRVMENTLEAFQYQWYPFEQVVEDLHLEIPALKVSFNMLSMRESEAETDLEELEAFTSENITEAKFPLIIRLTEYRNGIEIDWDGQKSLFKPSSLERMATRYIELLETIPHL